MTFTFNQYPILTPEQQNPMNALISRAMDTFQKGTKAAYQPRKMEADIFAKEIGPLAALASSPNFTGFNPQVQKMIAERIHGYLGSHGEQGEGRGLTESTPGYASDKDIFARLKHGSDITQSPGGQLKTAKSNLVGQAEKWGLPHSIAQILGGSGEAGESAAFDQVQNEAVQRLKLKGYSESQARKMIEQQKGESNEAYASRIQPLFVGDDNGTMDQEDLRSHDNQDLTRASNISQQLAAEGYDIPETVIFDYMQKHPGKISLPKLFKAAGVKYGSAK